MSFLPTLEDEEQDDMFFVGEEDMQQQNLPSETNKDCDSCCSESTNDSAAEAAFGAFQANKALSRSTAAAFGNDSKDGDGNEPHVTIRRNDSYVSFLTRSERHREHPDVPPSPKEDAKRSVHFIEEHNMEHYHELDPPLSKKEKRVCFLNDDDFDRMQLDVDMTLRRWSFHEEGKLPFDHTKNTLRGLESVNDRKRPIIVYKHTQKVLQEIHRQKVDHGRFDWELVRQISRQSSSKDLQGAVEKAKKDAADAIEAWQERNSPQHSPKDESARKKKGLGSLRFWSSKKDKK